MRTCSVLGIAAALVLVSGCDASPSSTSTTLAVPDAQASSTSTPADASAPTPTVASTSTTSSLPPTTTSAINQFSTTTTTAATTTTSGTSTSPTTSRPTVDTTSPRGEQHPPPQQVSPVDGAVVVKSSCISCQERYYFSVPEGAIGVRVSDRSCEESCSDWQHGEATDPLLYYLANFWYSRPGVIWEWYVTALWPDGSESVSDIWRFTSELLVSPTLESPAQGKQVNVSVDGTPTQVTFSWVNSPHGVSHGLVLRPCCSGDWTIGGIVDAPAHDLTLEIDTGWDTSDPGERWDWEWRVIAMENPLVDLDTLSLCFDDLKCSSYTRTFSLAVEYPGGFGTVIDAVTDLPVPDATVSWTSNRTGSSQTSLTSQTGEYSLADLIGPQGIIGVERDGYETQSIQVILNDTPTELNFALTPTG